MIDSSYPITSIRKAVSEDCFLLSDLGKRAYRQHFTYLWTPEGLEAFFEFAYAPEYFKTVLQQNDAIIWLAEQEGAFAGYLMYFRQKCLPAEEAEGGYINRIYLLEGYQGQGIGTLLLECAFQQARQDKRPYVWLESMQSSDQSIQFYQKYGFEICGATAFTKVTMRRPELAKMWYMRKEMEVLES